MAVPSPHTSDFPPKESLKDTTSQMPSPVTLQASEAMSNGTQISATSTANGTVEQPAADHHARDIPHVALKPNSDSHNTTNLAAGPAAGTRQVSASLLPAGTEATATLAQLAVPSANTPRENLHDNQKDKDGDKPEDPANYSTPPLNQSLPIPPHHSSALGASIATSQSNGDGKLRPPGTPQTSKTSFLSKLLRVLVPCVSSSAIAHSVELGDPSPLSSSKEKDKPSSAEHIVSDIKAPIVPPSNVTPSQAPVVSEPVVDLITAIPSTAMPSTPPPTDTDVFASPSPSPHLLPHSETEGLTSGAVQPPGSTGGSNLLHEKSHPNSRDSTVPSNASEGEESEGTSFTEDEDIDGLDDEDDEDKLIMNGGAGIPVGPDGVPKPLLPPISPQHAGRKCLILDLDETLVHSSFKSIQQADYVVPVEIEYHWHNVYVIKRPGVDNFLKKMGEIYEVVVFTASLSKYADPVLDKLDVHQVVSHRLFRESCYNHKGNYVKDLSQLGRPIADTIILDNSPASYIFHPNNAVPVSSWFNDPHDTELTDLVPFLADLSGVDDVRGVLDGAR